MSNDPNNQLWWQYEDAAKMYEEERMMEIVKLRESPPIDDIPAWLRKIADSYEAGGYPGVDFMMLIIPAVDQENDWPEVRGLGRDPGTQSRAGLVALVQSWLTINMVSRQG